MKVPANADVETLDYLLIRLRNHVCESFAILEELERIRKTHDASVVLPGQAPASARVPQPNAATGWLAAGY